ncbi:SDR family oxidoreductase [Streptomyces sp. NBC_01808]|uniref:SDR family NAD(P)-dependent oxidoreductase n=1 Tax=Streptomyces sp. NBC_01808 TaxID=2975947 RepID=UPI002DDBCCE8|nr:SDR family oxidoreductase [Streptomyces sp. NBC_01808]WSA41752.1 SDR family oxidoreductase [Streptomyces sp. NBC_01808]
MLLKDKNALVYGAGGIGRAVALGFAREGATVYLASRTPARLEAVAADVREAGGTVSTAVVDALDETAVDAHADAVAKEAGSIDVSINLVSVGDIQGTPLAEMTLSDFEAPVHNAVRTTFLTSKAAARHMIRQKSGVLLTFGGVGDPMHDYFIGGFQVALSAVDMLRKQFAAELGPRGVRVVGLKTGGIPESIPEGFEGRDELVASLVEPTMLGRTATYEDVGNAAAFAASDRAAPITASELNITCGAIVD